jgi:putative oxidoreductase
MSKLLSTRVPAGGLNFALLLLRVVPFALMFLHGWDKLMTFSQKKGVFPDPLHVGHAVSLSLTIFAEALCAALLVLGLLTRLAAIPLVICMGVVVFMVQANAPIGQKELAIVYLVIATALLFTGPGRFSVDKLMGK